MDDRVPDASQQRNLLNCLCSLHQPECHQPVHTYRTRPARQLLRQCVHRQGRQCGGAEEHLQLGEACSKHAAAMVAQGCTHTATDTSNMWAGPTAQVVLAYGAESDRKLNIPGEVRSLGACKPEASLHHQSQPAGVCTTTCPCHFSCCLPAGQQGRVCSAGVCLVVQRSSRPGAPAGRPVQG